MLRHASLARLFAVSFVSIFIALSLSGCGSGSASNTGGKNSGGGPGPVVNFGADKTTVAPGDLVTLSWSTQNATSVTITPNVSEEAPGLSGTATVAPNQTTTYTISATGPGGTSTKSVTVTVNALPPTVQLSGSPATIISGQSSTLQWTSTYADKITIDNGVGSVTVPNGTVDVQPAVTTTYTATATGPGGSQTSSFTVTVAPPSSLAVSLTADPATITTGQSSTLSWTSQGAASLTISGIGPVQGTSGNVTVTPTATTTYTITATDSSSQTATASATVTVASANAGLQNIKHIIFLMQENRSFDNYFGMLGKYRASKGLPNDIDGLDTSKIFVDKDGHKYHPFHSPTVCIDVTSPGWNESHFYAHRKSDGMFAMDNWVAAQSDSQAQYTGGRDPYVTRDLSYYDQTELPYYYELATQFATSDRWFSSLMGPTIPNRMYLFTGTSFGFIRPDDPNHPQYSQKTIFDAMNEAGVQWRYYYRDGSVFLPQFDTWNDPVSQGRVRNISEYYSILADPNADNLLPPVVFLEQAAVTELNEHPSSGNFQNGAADTKKLIDALMNSAAWQSSVFILTYDEAGGLYDHVPPIQVPPPDDIPPNFNDTDGGRYDTFTYSGFRVPVIVVSPWVKKNYVSHTPRTFTSILKLIETRFGVPPLTNRDGQADDMTEFFDFSNPAWMTPPPLPDQPTNGLCDRTQEVAPMVQ